jgi:hypothetical protein
VPDFYLNDEEIAMIRAMRELNSSEQCVVRTIIHDLREHETGGQEAKTITPQNVIEFLRNKQQTSE